MSLKYSQLEVSPELLLGWLQAPEGMAIRGAMYDPFSRSVRFILTHPTLSPNEYGQLEPTLYSVRLDCGHDEITADWGLVHVPAE